MEQRTRGWSDGYPLTDMRDELEDLQRRIDTLRRGGVASRVIDDVQRNLDAVRRELERWAPARPVQHAV